MKVISVISFLFLSTMTYAGQFHPVSGMKFTCYDNVSAHTYALAILDIGDEEAEVTVFKNKKILSIYHSAIFNENDQGSFFLVVGQKGRQLFSINFPYNDLNEAYYADGGDSRALKCKVLR